MFDPIVSGGTVVDGTGRPSHRTDVEVIVDRGVAVDDGACTGHMGGQAVP